MWELTARVFISHQSCPGNHEKLQTKLYNFLAATEAYLSLIGMLNKLLLRKHHAGIQLQRASVDRGFDELHNLTIAAGQGG